MAQAYPYFYDGIWTFKQDKCRTSMPLDKPRIWLDFNELCACGPAGEPVYFFSRADIVNDSCGNDVELYEGMAVSVFDDDLDDAGEPDALLAEGILVRNTLGRHPQIKWLIQLTETACGSEDPYVYWMSSLP